MAVAPGSPKEQGEEEPHTANPCLHAVLESALYVLQDGVLLKPFSQLQVLNICVFESWSWHLAEKNGMSLQKPMVLPRPFTGCLGGCSAHDCHALCSSVMVICYKLRQVLHLTLLGVHFCHNGSFLRWQPFLDHILW